MSCIQVYVSENTSRIKVNVEKVNYNANLCIDLINYPLNHITEVNNPKLQISTSILENTIIYPTITLSENLIKFSYSAVCMISPTVPSCFGAGYWIGKSPWIRKIAWKGK